MHQLKLTAIGNSTGVILPKELLARLRLGKGDAIYLVEMPDGYLLTPYDAQFARQIEAAEGVMKRYRNTLRELAK